MRRFPFRSLAALTILLAAAPVSAREAVPPGLPTSFETQLNQPITANFEAVDFASAIQFLSESAGVNIVLSEQARAMGRPVTGHLVGMPLSHALEYLLKGQGLLYRFDDRTIWVATREELESEPMETRVFMLSQGPGLVASFEPMEKTREGVALEATAVREMKTIKDILNEVIPETSGSSMMLDERTGALVVTHAPYYLEQIEALLTQLDVTPLQVLIEARFIEVVVSDTKELGLDAQLTGDAALTKQGAANGTRSPGLQLSSIGSSLARGTKTSFTDFTNQTSGNGLNLTLEGILNGTQYQTVLHALAQNERTKTLSAPRVTTLNNQTATMKVVTEFVYASRYEASVVREDLNSDGDFRDTVSGVNETRFVNVPQDFVTKDLGILLHVTPSIGQDHRTITLALKPEVSEKTADDEFGGEVTLPRFSARNLETSVVMENGQTVVLGGLMKDTTTKTVTKVPVLGSIPVIGGLFRKDSDAAERSNLLIFVTAQIMDPAGAHLAREDDPEP